MKNVKELFALRRTRRSALFFLLLSCVMGSGYSKALPARGGGRIRIRSRTAESCGDRCGKGCHG